MANNTQSNTDFITNMVMATTMSSCVNIISQNIPKIIEFVFLLLSSACYFVCTIIIRKSVKIYITGSIKNDNNTIDINFPIEYYAIINRILSEDGKFNNIQYTTENKKCVDYTDSSIQFENTYKEFYITEYFKFIFFNDVCVEFFTPKDSKQNIVISSIAHNLETLEKIIMEWTNEYKYTNKEHNKITTSALINIVESIIYLRPTTEYKAIMSKILNSKINLQNITYAHDVDKKNNFYDVYSSDQNLHFYVSKYTKIIIDENICIEFLKPMSRSVNQNAKFSIDENKDKNNDKDIGENKNKQTFNTETLLQMFIISSKNYSLEKLNCILKEWTEEYISNISINKTNMITISASLGETKYYSVSNFPIEYRMVIAKLTKKKQNLHWISYINNDTSPWQNDKSKNDINHYRYFVNSNKQFLLEDNIYVKFSKYKNTKEEPTTYEIDISSVVYETPKIQEIISYWANQFQKESQIYKDDGTIYYYSLNKIQSDSSSSSKSVSSETSTKESLKNDVNVMMWTRNELTSNKTFDNIFFSNKNTLLKKLDHFIKNEDWYKKKECHTILDFYFTDHPAVEKPHVLKQFQIIPKDMLLKLI